MDAAEIDRCYFPQQEPILLQLEHQLTELLKLALRAREQIPARLTDTEKMGVEVLNQGIGLLRQMLGCINQSQGYNFTVAW